MSCLSNASNCLRRSTLSSCLTHKTFKIPRRVTPMIIQSPSASDDCMLSFLSSNCKRSSVSKSCDAVPVIEYDVAKSSDFSVFVALNPSEIHLPNSAVAERWSRPIPTVRLILFFWRRSVGKSHTRRLPVFRCSAKCYRRFISAKMRSVSGRRVSCLRVASCRV